MLRSYCRVDYCSSVQRLCSYQTAEECSGWKQQNNNGIHLGTLLLYMCKQTDRQMEDGQTEVLIKSIRLQNYDYNLSLHAMHGFCW